MLDAEKVSPVAMPAPVPPRVTTMTCVPVKALKSTRSVPAAADELIGPETAGRAGGDKPVVASAAVHDVVAKAAVEHVVLEAALQRVVAKPALQRVGAGSAIQHVVIGAAVEIVGAGAAIKRIFPGITP